MCAKFFSFNSKCKEVPVTVEIFHDEPKPYKGLVQAAGHEELSPLLPKTGPLAPTENFYLKMTWITKNLHTHTATTLKVHA